jgi:hypothetical protein
MEHWLKAHYIFLRLTKERTDDVGKEYLTYYALEEDLKYGKSVKWLIELLNAKKSGLDPWDILVAHKPELAKMSKKEVLQNSEKFNYREIAGYIIKNKAPGDNFIEAIITEYAELSSYVHGGPRGTHGIVRLASKRFDEYKGMVRFVFNMNKAIFYTAYVAFAQLGDKSLFKTVKDIGDADWV